MIPVRKPPPAAAALPAGGTDGQVLGKAGGGVEWVDLPESGAGVSAGRVAYRRYRLSISGSVQLNSHPSIAEFKLYDSGSGAAISVANSSGSHFQSYVPANAFDNDPATFWVALSEQTGVLQAELPTPAAVARYEIRADQPYGDVEAPTDWNLEGSNDGGAWTVLHTVTNQTTWAKGELKSFDIPGIVTALEPEAMPKITDAATLPNSGQALLVSSMPPRMVYRHSDGTLYYGPLYSATP